MKKALALLLTLACVLTLAGCTVRSTTQLVEKSVSTLQEIADAALDPETDAPESGDTFITAENPEEQQMLPEEETVLLPEDTEISQTSDTLDEHGSYYDAESVVLYLDAYGHLPDNYITKSDARALGWEGGSVEVYRPSAAIGGASRMRYIARTPRFSRSTARCSSSISTGRLSISMRSRDAASSMRSIALSGRNRSVM